MRLEEGRIVRCEAGHDQNHFYVIVKVEDGFAWIADGRRRRLEKPKKKNFRHIKPTNQSVSPSEIDTNQKIRRVLHPFQIVSATE